MKKNTTRILAIIIALVMILGSVPLALMARAETTSGVYSEYHYYVPVGYSLEKNEAGKAIFNNAEVNVETISDQDVGIIGTIACKSDDTFNTLWHSTSTRLTCGNPNIFGFQQTGTNVDAFRGTDNTNEAKWYFNFDGKNIKLGFTGECSTNGTYGINFNPDNKDKCIPRIYLTVYEDLANLSEMSDLDVRRMAMNLDGDDTEITTEWENVASKPHAKTDLSFVTDDGTYTFGYDDDGAPYINYPDTVTVPCSLYLICKNEDNSTTAYRYAFKPKGESEHTHEYSEVRVEPTCTEAGRSTKTCECGDIVEEDLPALGHGDTVDVVIAAPTCKETGITYTICKRCEEAVKTTYTEPTGCQDTDDVAWVVEQEATAEHKGLMVKRCKCGEILATEEFDLHEHEAEEAVTLKAATCTEPGLSAKFCSVCGACFDVTEIEAKGHGDSIGVVTTAPTCTEKGEKTYYCVDCGKIVDTEAIDEIDHINNTTVVAPTCTEEGYTIETCIRCGLSNVVDTESALGHADTDACIKAAPTCTTSGVTEYVCPDCHEVVKTVYTEPLGHMKSAPWEIETEATADHKGLKVQRCRCGEIIASEEFDLHEHKFGYAVVSEATCCEKGCKKSYCDICGACYDVEYTDKIAHSEIKVVTNATCSAEGKTETYCKDCGKLLDSKVIKKTEHNGYWLYVNEPTADHKGLVVLKCAVCGEILDTKKVDAHEHDGYSRILTPATCTDNGEKGYFCTDCGACYKVETIEALGHSEGVCITKAPTCTEPGEKTTYCDRCGQIIKSEVVEPEGHDDGVTTITVKPTCDASGEAVTRCTKCGEIIDVQTLEATGHDCGVWKIDYEPTADHNGQMSRYCTHCGVVLETTAFEKHTHSEGYRKTITAPTCTANGEGGVFCADCGVCYSTYEIEKTGHDWSDWSTNNDGTHVRTCLNCRVVETNNCSYTNTVIEPTCVDGGYTTHVCDVCGYTFVDTYTEANGHAWKAWTDCGDCHSRGCSECDAEEVESHNYGPWTKNNDKCFCRNETKTHTCMDCGHEETVEIEHSSVFMRIFYPIYIWLKNVIVKIQYICSLYWFIPCMNIYPNV